ncbi:hypothetical protein HPB49_017615 [Dermacentor silvarum]|uniref:Uncharacterized protein n=1 Tax=Dermacentor silvarum TaxID=543639 RepID=A0ACB8D6H6_DERSI|nr:hypothetical protein HPB49_017615 [Dermacentor silvarum]
MSPFLFNLALASLPSAIPVDFRHGVYISVYADDVALWTLGPTRSLPAVRSCLQRALDEVVSYFQAVGLVLHFKPSDLRDDCKRRQLNPGNVPSVFSARTPRTEKCGAPAKPEDRETGKRKREPSPKVAADEEDGSAKAVLLRDQVKSYKKKKPQWSEITIRHCIVSRHLSTKTYEHITSEGLLRLPCRSTLQKYIGTVAGEVGFNDLVRCRLEAELQKLHTPQSKVCGLVVDEMRIREKRIYTASKDAFVGYVDMNPELQDIGPSSVDEVLANSFVRFTVRSALEV